MEHKIEVEPGTVPVRSKPYRLSPLKEAAARENVALLIKNGLIRPSNSPWASPIVLVPKAGAPGKLRMVIDYRKLNSKTKKDAYPIPRIDECLALCRNAKWITTIDVKDAYHHIPMEESSKQFTAFLTPGGLHEWQVLPLGLCNAPATFQRHVDTVMRPFIGKSVAAYFDDVIVYSKGTLQEHIDQVVAVLARLKEAKLQAKPEKCHFAMKKAKILGHLVQEGTIRPDPDKISGITHFPLPQNVSHLRSFLGLANYYRDFIRNYTKIVSPLYELTRKNTPFEWSHSRMVAFQAIKDALTSAPCLYPADQNKPFILQTDASGEGLAAILVQPHDDGEHPVAFKSRRLTKAEKNYSATEQECLAVVWGVDEFDHHLSDCHFTVVTDHSALKWLPLNHFANKRLMRWALRLQELDFEVVHRPGKNNANADALSRYPVSDAVPMEDEDDQSHRLPPPPPEYKPPAHHKQPMPPLPPLQKRKTVQPAVAATALDASPSEENNTTNCIPLVNDGRFKEIVTAYPDDPKIGILYEHLKTGCKVYPATLSQADRRHLNQQTHHYHIDTQSGALYFSPHSSRGRVFSTLPGYHRLVIPQKYQQSLIELAHDSPFGSHMGIGKTFRRLSAYYQWDHMFEDVSNYIQSCAICVEHKLRRKDPASNISRLPVASSPLDFMSVDTIQLTGGKSGDLQYVVVFIDHFTRYVVAVPTTNLTAETIATVFLDEVCYKIGCPRVLLSDNGTEYNNKLFRTLCLRAGIKKLWSPAYHPQSNGIAERVNGTIKTALYTLVRDQPHRWSTLLAPVIFGINTSIDSHNFSPFWLMFGREGRAPGWVGPPADQDPAYLDEYVTRFYGDQTTAYNAVKAHQEEERKKLQALNDTKVSVVTYSPGDRVLLQSADSLTHKLPATDRTGTHFLPTYVGPYQVEKKLENSENLYEVTHLYHPGAPSELVSASRMRLIRMPPENEDNSQSLLDTHEILPGQQRLDPGDRPLPALDEEKKQNEDTLPPPLELPLDHPPSTPPLPPSTDLQPAAPNQPASSLPAPAPPSRYSLRHSIPKRPYDERLASLYAHPEALFGHVLRHSLPERGKPTGPPNETST